MATNVPLRCACGKITGTLPEISASDGLHVVCYCHDCQAFARFLGRGDITDEWGGTHIFQMAPSKLHISEGADALSCMRLSVKGMHRWYCGACKTPIGNTLGPSMPFVGLICSFIDWERVGRSKDDVLGKPQLYGFPEAAVGGIPPHTRNNRKLLYLLRIVGSLGKWWITRAGFPSPFFDQKTRTPRAPVRILSPGERQKL